MSHSHTVSYTGAPCTAIPLCTHSVPPTPPPPPHRCTHPPTLHPRHRQTDRQTHTHTGHQSPHTRTQVTHSWRSCTRAPLPDDADPRSQDPPPGRGPRPYTQAPSTCHPALHSRRRSTLYLASAASCSLACLACAGKEAVGVTTTVRPHTLCDLTRVRVRANAEPLAPPHAGTGVGQGWRRPDLPPRGAPRGGVPRAPTTTTCQGG